MAVTKNGRKATWLRGFPRMWMAQTSHGIEIFETRPGVEIQDVDTMETVVGLENWTCGSHLAAWKREAWDTPYGTTEPGWYVCRGTNVYGPFPTKKAVEKELRRALAEIKRRYW